MADILQRLEGVKGRDGKYMARCPNHGDSNPSLSVSLGDDNKILLKCFAGCSTEDIVWSMDLQMKDLFAEVTPATAFPVYEEPQRKQSTTEKPNKEAEYLYAGGQLKKIKYRRTGGSKYCTWLHKEADGSWAKGRNNIAPGLYCCHQLDNAESLFIVEGERMLRIWQKPVWWRSACQTVPKANGRQPMKRSLPVRRSPYFRTMMLPE